MINAGLREATAAVHATSCREEPLLISARQCQCQSAKVELSCSETSETLQCDKYGKGGGESGAAK